MKLCVRGSFVYFCYPNQDISILQLTLQIRNEVIVSFKMEHFLFFLLCTLLAAPLIWMICIDFYFPRFDGSIHCKQNCIQPPARARSQGKKRDTLCWSGWDLFSELTGFHTGKKHESFQASPTSAQWREDILIFPSWWPVTCRGWSMNQSWCFQRVPSWSNLPRRLLVRGRQDSFFESMIIGIGFLL